MISARLLLREAVLILRRIRTGPDLNSAMAAQRFLDKIERKKIKPSTKLRRTKKRLSRRALVAAVRPIVEARAKGQCEACTFAFGFDGNTPEWDEFGGRREVSVESTWMLCRDCHHRKTENFPSRQFWEITFAVHCKRHGYPLRKRLTRRIAPHPAPSAEGDE